MRPLVLLALLLSGCAPLSPADRATLARGGICVGVSLARAVASAALDMALNTPTNESEWGAWGKQLAAKHGADPFKCAVEVVAELATPEPLPPARVIGFQPTAATGPTAGPSSPSSGVAGVGSVTVAPSRAVAFARWARGQ